MAQLQPQTSCECCFGAMWVSKEKAYRPLLLIAAQDAIVFWWMLDDY